MISQKPRVSGLFAFEGGIVSGASFLSMMVFGGQLLQAAIQGHELFYCSPGPYQPGAARRGGVPVLFPQFALAGSLPKHGFARNQDWQVRCLSSQAVQAELELTAGDFPAWPHAARLTLTVIEAELLTLTLRIENTGDTSWPFTGGLHPYWLVEDVAACELQGLSVTGLGAREIDEWHATTTAVTLQEGGSRLRLTQQGFEGWQVWSPGPAHALTDMPHADWRRFLCIEPVVMTPRWLAPGEVFVGVLQAQRV